MRKITVFAIAVALLLAATVTHAEDGWSGTVSLGANITEGNSETVTLSPEATATGKKGDNEFRFRAVYNYGESDDDITQRNAKGEAKYNRLFSERWYAYANGEIGFDDLADINYRAIVGPGIGTYLIKGDEMNLSVEAGASWIAKDQDILQPSGDVESESSDEWAFRVAQTFDMVINEAAKVWESIEYLPLVDDVEVYLLTIVVGVETKVSEVLSLRVTVENRHDSDPVPGIEEDDTSLKAAVVYTFGS